MALQENLMQRLMNLTGTKLKFLLSSHEQVGSIFLKLNTSDPPSLSTPTHTAQTLSNPLSSLSSQSYTLHSYSSKELLALTAKSALHLSESVQRLSLHSLHEMILKSPPMSDGVSAWIWSGSKDRKTF